MILQLIIILLKHFLLFLRVFMLLLEHLLVFAEYLDCVFTTRDGCTGGATHVCFDYNQRTGHMASQDNYPYTATDVDRYLNPV